MKSMSDHEFEKKVQSSLEQLKLRPSVAVWAAVESNIRKDKRRRRMIMWLPLCLLFLGAGGYFMLQNNRQPEKQQVAAQTTAPASSTTSSNTPTNTSSDNNNSTLTKDRTTSSTTAETIKDNNPASVEPATKQPEAADPATTAHQPLVKTTTPAPVTSKAVKATKAIATVQQPEIIVKRQRQAGIQKESPEQKIKQGIKGKGQRKGDQLAVQNDLVDQALPVAQSDTTNTSNTVVMLDKPVNGAVAPTDSLLMNKMPDTVALVSTTTVDSTALAIAAPVDSAKKEAEGVKQPEAQAVATPAEIKPIVRPKRGRWQWGVQAEGGYAGITQDGLFGGLFSFLSNKSELNKVADPARFDQFSNGLNSYAPQFPRPVNKPSEITMGPSFAVGGFVQRTLSRRFTLAVGLQYAYLSTRTVVGAKVDNARTVNQALATAQVVNSYYDANNTENYTNQYHFIEIPVTLHTQLNKGIRLPLVWDIGFSAARMIGTSALHYDGLGGVYYKDNSLFNKTQWAIATGFNVGLFQKSKHPIAVGPSVRYNMTSLLKKDYNTGQHLWSAGLKVSMLLKK
jgi:cytoskeletal protein RodZ